MKYMVLVNGKWMVAVDAESVCAAEHVILDKFADSINKNGTITGALAFDRDGMKTDYYFRLLENSQTISFETLEWKIGYLDGLVENIQKAKDEEDCINHEIDEIEDRINRLAESLKEKREELDLAHEYTVMQVEKMEEKRKAFCE